MRYKLFWIILFIGVFIVFLLSWLPQPNLESYWFIPKWISKWTDSVGNENLRTAVPFLFLGGFAGLWLAAGNRPFKQWFIAWLLNVVVVSIAELGQLFVPNRTCDIKDVLWGASGAFIGLALASLTKIKINLDRKPKPQFGLK